MKIIINVGSLSLGGAERVAVDLANGLADRGHQVVVLSNLNKPITYILDKSVVLRHFNSRNIKRCIPSIWQYSRIIKNEKPDAVLGFGSYQSFLAKMSQIVSGHRCVVVYTEHNVLDRPKDVPMTKREYFYKFYFSRICDAMTVLTQADKVYAETKLKNLQVMPNPLALTPIQDVGECREKIIISVGRLNVWHVKGFDLLLNAWGKLCQKYPDWKLQIVGAGDEQDRKRLLSFAQGSGCENYIEILPFTDDIASVFRKATIFVLSSRYEGFGLVLTEAMSQGCACLAADYKGRQAEIVTHGVNGLLCETDSVDAIVKGIQKLIDDENLRKRLQTNAILRSKDFLAADYAKRWEELLVKLICRK